MAHDTNQRQFTNPINSVKKMNKDGCTTINELREDICAQRSGDGHGGWTYMYIITRGVCGFGKILPFVARHFVAK